MWYDTIEPSMIISLSLGTNNLCYHEIRVTNKVFCYPGNYITYKTDEDPKVCFLFFLLITPHQDTPCHQGYLF